MLNNAECPGHHRESQEVAESISTHLGKACIHLSMDHPRLIRSDLQHSSTRDMPVGQGQRDFGPGGWKSSELPLQAGDKGM